MKVTGELWKGSGRGTDGVKSECEVASLLLKMEDGTAITVIVADHGVRVEVLRELKKSGEFSGGTQLLGRFQHELKPMLYTPTKGG